MATRWRGELQVRLCAPSVSHCRTSALLAKDIGSLEQGAFSPREPSLELQAGSTADRSAEGIEEAAVWGIGAKKGARLYVPG